MTITVAAYRQNLKTGNRCMGLSCSGRNIISEKYHLSVLYLGLCQLNYTNLFGLGILKLCFKEHS